MRRQAARSIGWTAALLAGAAALGVASTAGIAADPAAADGRVLDLPAHTRWETFTKRDGLPSDRVFSVRIDGGRVWAGTDRGLALYEDGRWRSFTTADGLPNPVVLALDVSPRTGDLWAGTMGGLARVSAGRIDAFNQMNSGLSNDFVHAVRCDPDEDQIWTGNAMGSSRLDLRTGTWSLYDQTNTPMHEPWCYTIGISGGRVYIGAWGGGVLEYTKATGVWREYRDPDKQFDLDLLPDDGPVSDVTSGLDVADGILWAASYVGLARYDGRDWRSFYASDSGLAGDFVNFTRSQGRFAWLATDQGLSLTDGDGWVTYRRLPDGRGEIRTFQGARPLTRQTVAAGPGHNYVLGVDAQGDDVWVATAAGVSHGRRATGSPPARAAGQAVPAGGPQGMPPIEGYPAPVPRTSDGRFHYAATPGPLLPYRGHLPYKDFFTERPRFRGPGREEPDPEDLEAVKIGFIGPLTYEDGPILPPGVRPITGEQAKVVFGRRMLRAATLALEEANAGGGYRGIPFRIVPRTDLVLWGQTSNELVRFAVEDRVVAILASIDSNHNHVLSRTTLKGEVPILTAGSSDPTLVEHNIPWLFRIIQDDRQQSYALLREVYVARGIGRVALLRVNDRDGRTGVGEFVGGSRRLGHPILIEQRFDVGDTVFGEQIARIRETSPDAIVLWGGPEETGRAVRQIREAGIAVPLFGFDRMAGADFVKVAGDAAEGLTAVATLNPDRDDPSWNRFRERYRNRWGEDPDTFAAHAYDGMNLLIGAVREAGVNRPRVRDVLARIRTRRGASGDLTLDTNLSNVAPLWLGTVRGGRYEYRAAPAWTDAEGGGGR